MRTSTPTVGSSTTGSLVLAVDSFDRLPFCWLPPESPPAFRARPEILMKTDEFLGGLAFPAGGDDVGEGFCRLLPDRNGAVAQDGLIGRLCDASWRPQWNQIGFC